MKTPNASSGPKLKNVVLISLDCVRAEALGCYPQRFPLPVRIPRGARTPNVDYLARNGHRFNQAITQAPFTPSAHASVFTGLIPPKHGIRTILGSRLDERTVTLTEKLASEGWRCGSVVASGSLGQEYGLARGFEFYDDDIQTGDANWILGERRGAVEVTDRAVNWLKTVSGERFFLFVHFFDAHAESAGSGVYAAERVLSSSAVSRLRPMVRRASSPIIDFIRVEDLVLVFKNYKVWNAGIDIISLNFSIGYFNSFFYR